MSKLIWTLMTVICYIKFSLSFEINKDNCINNKVLFSPCKFNIAIVPPINSDLQCQLRFTLTNSTLVSYFNNQTFIKSKVDNKCPTVELNIHNGTDNKINSNCGDNTNNISKVFPGFIYGSFFYKNNDLMDSETRINIDLILLGISNCYEGTTPAPPQNKTIIWILIACAVVLIIIIVIVIAIDCNRKPPPKKSNPQLIVKEDVDKKQNIKVDKTEKEKFPLESKPMIDETNA